VTDDPTKILALIAIGLAILFIFLLGEAILRRRKQRIIERETMLLSWGDLTKFDDASPGEAVMLAWLESEDFPYWHSVMKTRVRRNMPHLARALDRMVEN
jgi:hypothetical protein